MADIEDMLAAGYYRMKVDNKENLLIQDALKRLEDFLVNNFSFMRISGELEEGL